MDLYQILITHNRGWSALETICFSVLFLIVAFIMRSLHDHKKIVRSQLVAGLAVVLFLGVVFASTVFTRIPSGEMQYELLPFWSWRHVLVNHSKEMLKENLLNMLLLFPFGLLLPLVFHKNIRWYRGFGYGFFVSAVIEFCQLVFQRGLFEWDDMIHNAIGCMVGCIIMDRIIKWRNKRKQFLTKNK